MTTTDTKLTRAEDAYAHLASFMLGDKVDVGGRSWFQPGTVTDAQQDNGEDIRHAYLVVAGCGVTTKITVGALLAGQFTITSEADARDGKVRYFDAVGYAAQNRDELQARVDAELRERAYNEAHYLSNASAYFPARPV